MGCSNQYIEWWVWTRYTEGTGLVENMILGHLTAASHPDIKLNTL